MSLNGKPKQPANQKFAGCLFVLRELDYITEEQHGDGEEVSPVKHEWFRGEVFAMAGRSCNHSTLCGNTHITLQNALRGKLCKARNSEQRVKIESNGLETYPDAVIFCPPSRFIGKGDSTLLTPTSRVDRPLPPHRFRRMAAPHLHAARRNFAPYER